MDRNQKVQCVESMQEKLVRAKAAFIIDFKGINVEQVTQLRNKLRPLNAEMKVVRNTLALRALEAHKAKRDAIGDHLIGTNAFVFAFGDAQTLVVIF